MGQSEMNAELTATYSRSLPLRLTVSFFAAALFTSAALLFWVQPLIAKMLLPVLGGAASVWNTCMVFFQALLLGGYAYVLLISRVRLRTQMVLHVMLLLSASIFLPFAVPASMLSSLPTQGNPIFWLLSVLVLTVGFPFFVLSATAPLLQNWFSHSKHTAARDPYFLYAVSNAGSMLSLLAFPFLLEPRWDLRTQSHYWSLGFVLLTILIGSCALLLRVRPIPSLTISSVKTAIAWKVRLGWVLLAFIPSSLMLGVTTYISTDVASVPLIWIVPLALYLLTFILAFARKQIVSLKLLSLLLPALIIPLGFITVLRPPISVWILIALHLLVFFLAALLCHRQIADSRPAVDRLAEYYLWISIGGVAGGIFNALLAPIVFSAPIEYPLMIVAACAMRPTIGRPWSKRWLNVAFPLAMLLLTFAMTTTLPKFHLPLHTTDALVVCVPLTLSYFLASKQRLGFALSLLAVMVGSYVYLSDASSGLITTRNFFGVWRVSSKGSGGFDELQHGSTVHGGQFKDAERKCLATSYFHKDGPLGQIFNAYLVKPTSKHVAAVGLGAGTVVTYASPDETWDFYDIDPAIIRIASDPHYFSFLSDCASAPYKILVGDARLRLQEAPDQHYGLLILDAFSSDSVPTHLVTKQAIDLYKSKLTKDGIIGFHISNRYLRLEPLLSGLATTSGLVARIRVDQEADRGVQKYPSIWVVMTSREEELGPIATDPRWRALTGDVVWTDEYSNILSLMK